MDMKTNLAHRLREIRQQKGLSITEFSEELEIARSSLQSLLSGDGNPRTDTIEHIANRLGVDPISLLSDSPSARSSAPATFTKDQQAALTQLLAQLTDVLGDGHE